MNFWLMMTLIQFNPQSYGAQATIISQHHCSLLLIYFFLVLHSSTIITHYSPRYPNFTGPCLL